MKFCIPQSKKTIRYILLTLLPPNYLNVFATHPYCINGHKVPSLLKFGCHPHLKVSGTIFSPLPHLSDQQIRSWCFFSFSCLHGNNTLKCSSSSTQILDKSSMFLVFLAHLQQLCMWYFARLPYSSYLWPNCWRF